MTYPGAREWDRGSEEKEEPNRECEGKADSGEKTGGPWERKGFNGKKGKQKLEEGEE